MFCCSGCFYKLFGNVNGNGRRLLYFVVLLLFNQRCLSSLQLLFFVLCVRFRSEMHYNNMFGAKQRGWHFNQKHGDVWSPFQPTVNNAAWEVLLFSKLGSLNIMSTSQNFTHTKYPVQLFVRPLTYVALWWIKERSHSHKHVHTLIPASLWCFTAHHE